MNHHDIRLIEIGQKDGYAKAVKEIAAWVREEANFCRVQGAKRTADEIEANFGGRDAS